MADDYKSANQEEVTNMSESLVNSDKPQVKSRPGGCKGALQWYMEKPLARWPFLLFLIFALLTLIWMIMYLVGSTTGYILAGISAIVMAAYATNHFRLLLGLKEEVDKMGKLNKEFKQENASLRQEVDKLSRARVQLQSVDAELRESNVRLKNNLVKFRELDDNLKNLSDNNLEGLSKLKKTSQAVMDRWTESLIKNEKAILNKVYDKFEFKDGNADLSEDEFHQFLDSLPSEYRKQFQAMGKTFKQLAGDDNMMQYEEFTALVDAWVDNVATDGGSGHTK